MHKSEVLMKTRRFLLFSVFLATAQIASAGFGAGNPRLEKLYGAFISPCCWRENLALHDSEIARELRRRIQTMVGEGRTDDEIKTTLVKQYTRQILALPDGTQGVWLFLTPCLAVLSGVAGLLVLLNRMRSSSAVPAMAALPPAELEDGWDQV